MTESIIPTKVRVISNSHALSSSFDPGFNTFADRQMLLKSSQESFFIVVYIVDSKCRKYSFALL